MHSVPKIKDEALSSPGVPLRTPPSVEIACADEKWDGGDGLESGLKSAFEPRFGFHFPKVRIHTGSEANAIAEKHTARALTVGRDICFAAGEYDSKSPAG